MSSFSWMVSSLWTCQNISIAHYMHAKAHAAACYCNVTALQ